MQMEYIFKYTVYRKTFSQNTLHDYMFIIRGLFFIQPTMG
jgi:hypothetical protein